MYATQKTIKTLQRFLPILKLLQIKKIKKTYVYKHSFLPFLANDSHNLKCKKKIYTFFFNCLSAMPTRFIYKHITIEGQSDLCFSNALYSKLLFTLRMYYIIHISELMYSVDVLCRQSQQLPR